MLAYLTTQEDMLLKGPEEGLGYIRAYYRHTCVQMKLSLLAADFTCILQKYKY